MIQTMQQIQQAQKAYTDLMELDSHLMTARGMLLKIKKHMLEKDPQDPSVIGVSVEYISLKVLADFFEMPERQLAAILRRLYCPYKMFNRELHYTFEDIVSCFKGYFSRLLVLEDYS